MTVTRPRTRVAHSVDYDHGCRCDDCRDTMSRYQRHRVWAADRGTPFSTDPTGTVRRVQALARIGWRSADIADTTGLSTATIRRLMAAPPAVVVRKTRDGVRDAYDALWNIPGPSTRARSQATRKHWAPPLTWSEETIDDPTAKPDYGQRINQLHDPVVDVIAVERFIAGDRVPLTRAERREVVRRLVAAGTPQLVIQHRLSLSGTTLIALLREVA